MRLSDVAAAISVLFMIGFLFFRRRSRRVAWVPGGLLCFLMVAHAFQEGTHWQLIPLYLAVLVLCFSGLADRRWPRWGFVSFAGMSLSLVCAFACASWIVPMFELPRPTGRYAVGTRIFHLVDQNRIEENGPSPSGKRELIVQAWYPAEPPAKPNDHYLASYQRLGEVTLAASYRSVLKTNSWQDAPVLAGATYPVLIYNPGWMGERTEGTYQMEELASHGFVVVAIDHTFFGGRIEFPDGRVTDSRNAPRLGDFAEGSVEKEWALGAKYVGIEAADGTFVLDQLEAWNSDSSSPWFQKLDLTRVGAFGFSIGGAVAVQMAEQDARVKAALDLDGWLFGDFARNGLGKPMMVIYEDRRRVLPTAMQLSSGIKEQRLRWQLSVEDFDHVTGSLRRHGGYLLFIAGTEHVDFTDRSLFSPLKSLSGRGSVPPDRVHAIVNAYTLAFFSDVFNGDANPLLKANPAPFGEVEIAQY
jgi:dienelactone hydrolase